MGLEYKQLARVLLEILSREIARIRAGHVCIENLEAAESAARRLAKAGE